MTRPGWWSSARPQGNRRRDASKSERTPNTWAEFRAQLQQRRQSRPPSRLALLLEKAGWRRTAYVNTFLECVVAIVLTSILISTGTKAGSVTKSLVFYEGDCAKTARINIGLHLLINVASTCIVASSNYFMQILSSPTRGEVDVAHQKARSLEIGVPSIRNIGHISLRKGLLWSLFVASSVPIHVLFNSIVFETDYQGAGFFMAMATEAFVQSEEGHKGLGASLIYAGATMNLNFTGAEPSVSDDSEDAEQYSYLTSDRNMTYSWGGPTNISDYLNDASPIMRSIASTSKSARDWTRLDAHDCRAQYGTCTPRRNYGSVVLIMDGQFQKNDSSTAPRDDPDAGFVLEDIYDLTTDGVFWNEFNLATDDEVREYWAKFWPIDEPNPLWFAADCRITTDLGASNAECQHSCANPLGLTLNNPWMVMTGNEAVHIRETRESWDIALRFFNATFPEYHANWTSEEAYGDYFAFATVEERPVFRADAIGHDGFMRLTHCYAEPLQPLCKVAMSNELLLIVTVGVLVKVGLSVLTCVLVREVPLVTPGDAMASFIAKPDPTTEGRAAVGLPGAGSRSRNRREWSAGLTARIWADRKPARIAAGIPRVTWFRVYSLVAGGVIATAVLFGIAILYDPIDTQYALPPFSHDVDSSRGSLLTFTYRNDTFGHSKDGGAVIRDVFFSNGDFIGKVILANTPQLILSLCYFAFNALITRACSEMEWNSYAATYKALRVSHPEKGQVWTYRLQMPYQYSFPLIVLSVLLHWLVSNTIFVVITEGGQFT
jgi:hypothetical protein